MTGEGTALVVLASFQERISTLEHRGKLSPEEITITRQTAQALQLKWHLLEGAICTLDGHISLYEREPDEIEIADPIEAFTPGMYRGGEGYES